MHPLSIPRGASVVISSEPGETPFAPQRCCLAHNMARDSHGLTHDELKARWAAQESFQATEDKRLARVGEMEQEAPVPRSDEGPLQGGWLR